jgi:glutamyl-tRNA reductase
MTPRLDEPYESWASRVEMFERGRALQKLAQGESIESVMEEMSRRIMEKLLHPVYKKIRESIPERDLETDKQAYYAKMKLIGPAADHVEGNLFDKDQ